MQLALSSQQLLALLETFELERKSAQLDFQTKLGAADICVSRRAF